VPISKTLGFGSVLGYLAAGIVALFSTDAEILVYGVSCLRIMGIGYPMHAVG
jgi:Na+-driven multidrug efflux pump